MTCLAASGSQWMFHSVVGVVLPGTRNAPPMNTNRWSSRGSSGLAIQGDRQVGHRPERDQGDLAGSLARGAGDDVRRVALAEGSSRRRQLGVSEALRSVRLGRDLERADERDRAPERDLDVRPAGQLEDGQRVGGDLVRLDVAAAAGDGEDAPPRVTRPRRAAPGCRRSRCRSR